MSLLLFFILLMLSRRLRVEVALEVVGELTFSSWPSSPFSHTTSSSIVLVRSSSTFDSSRRALTAASSRKPSHRSSIARHHERFEATRCEAEPMARRCAWSVVTETRRER